MTVPQLPRGHFETVETMAPFEPAPYERPGFEPAPYGPERIEPLEPREERADKIAIIGPIAAVVLALTVCTLVLEHPAARVVAAGLATAGLIAAVVVLVMAKRPEPARHVARHARPPR